MPDKVGRLSDRERTFIDAMVRTNDPVQAAKVAGYAQPSSRGGEVANRPEIIARVQEAVAFKLKTRGAEVGVGVLLEIAEDKKSPAASRVMAARELVKLSGVADDVEGADKPLSSMTRAELVARAEQARQVLAELDAPVIEHEPDPAPGGGVFD